MLEGEAHRRAARAYSQLAVDGGEVAADGAGAKKEPLGDLGVGQPGRYSLSTSASLPLKPAGGAFGAAEAPSCWVGNGGETSSSPSA